MKKLLVIALIGLTLTSQLNAGPFVPDEEQPLPAPVVPAPAPVPVMPALDDDGVLDLSDLRLGNAGIIAIAPHFPVDMRGLYLLNNNIGPAGAMAIAQNLYRTPNLIFLIIKGNHIGVAGTRAIAQQLSDLDGGLQNLDLSNNYMGNAEMIELLSHPLPPNLEALVLSSNHIGDAGIITLANGLQQNPIANNSMLFLADNEFGDDGKQALRNAGYEERGEWWERNAPAA